MNEYVLVYAQNANTPEALSLLVLKDKPAWQKGKLNLPGGSIEAGETPVQAAARELYEETGYQPTGEVKLLGKIICDDAIIYCCKAVVAVFHDPKPREEETQGISWLYWQDVLTDKRLIPNLRVIIPLLRCDVAGWEIIDQVSSAGRKVHTISVEVPTYEVPT